MKNLRLPHTLKFAPANWIQARRTFRFFALCGLVGLIAGLGACGFHLILEVVQHFALDGLGGFRPEGAAGEKSLFEPFTTSTVRWILVALPALGGLLSGILVFACAPEAEGHGTDAAIDAYHRRDGRIRGRIPLVKTIASALTIGTGGSAGVEGPISQIGAGFGSILAKTFGLSLKERRILLAAGMGAGIGAIFRTPLAGALFAAEVLYRDMDFEYEVIAPGIIASVVAYSAFALAFGFDPLFVTPGFAFRDPLELLPYTLLAFAVAIGARAFIALFYGVRDFFSGIPIPKWLKPTLGGLLTGVLGFFLPEALCTGYGVIQGAFMGGSGIASHDFMGIPALALLVFATAKMVSTSTSVASGGSGGIFGPSIVIGGALGSSMGLFIDSLFPSWISAPGAFAMVGMAGFFAAAARTPISTVIMVSEMTGNYELLVPSMWVSMLAFLITAGGPSLYEKQEPTRSDSDIHRGNALRDALERLFVRDCATFRPRRNFPAIREDDSLEVALRAFDECGLTSLPITDVSGRLTGQLSLEVIHQTLAEIDANTSQLRAKDAALSPVSIHPDNTLAFALKRMTQTGRTELFVLDDAGNLLDLFGESDIGAMCEAQVENAIHEDLVSQDVSPITAVFRRIKTTLSGNKNVNTNQQAHK